MFDLHFEHKLLLTCEYVGLELECVCHVRLAQNNNNDHRNYVGVYESDADGAD